MIRIKYKKIDSNLVSVKNFSTRTHRELVYVAINLESFSGYVVDSCISRDAVGNVLSDSLLVCRGSSLVDIKKKIKDHLISCGVSFNIEVRNKKE